MARTPNFVVVSLLIGFCAVKVEDRSWQRPRPSQSPLLLFPLNRHDVNSFNSRNLFHSVSFSTQILIPLRAVSPSHPFHSFNHLIRPHSIPGTEFFIYAPSPPNLKGVTPAKIATFSCIPGPHHSHPSFKSFHVVDALVSQKFYSALAFLPNLIALILKGGLQRILRRSDKRTGPFDFFSSRNLLHSLIPLTV